MSRKLLVCFTMDVERIASKSPSGGPETWESAERSVTDYCAILAQAGYQATLFIVPDTADKQAGLFRQLKQEGHECGMHFHAQSWKDNYKDPDDHDYLGGYGPEEQYGLLKEAKEQCEKALGFSPVSFRPGNFSANDTTFRVLGSLGFTGGSVSQPGRCVPSYKAVWSKAPREIHRAHPAFRLVPGDLDFVEVPVTSDQTVEKHWTGVGDTRFEACDADTIIRAARAEIGHQIKEKAPLQHLCFFTHNFADYGQGKQSSRPVLQKVIDSLPAIAAEYDLEAEGCTIARAGQALKGDG